MPELPEVERAARLLRENAIGKTIQDIQTTDDSIVFSNVKHDDFAKELINREVINVVRYGKVFYLELNGDGRMPVLHFGMTGNIHIKGQAPLQYKDVRQKSDHQWPPRFMKFVLLLQGDGPSSLVEIAFVDARRLGRIRLCQSPMDEPPISDLGFDPILSMPSFEGFSTLLLKRTCPIKSLLLDQSFSAGIGNWLADEILYQARIHPEQRCHKLKDTQLSLVYSCMKIICHKAVEANADATKFPEDWLFHYRWGKGKKRKADLGEIKLKLPSGEPAVIKWITVGGRTSAIVPELQSLDPGNLKIVKRENKGDDHTTTEQPESDVSPQTKNNDIRSPEKKRRRVTKN